MGMRIHFREWEIDGFRRVLRVGPRELSPEPLVFDLLLYLASRADQRVSREELLREVWGGTSVSHWAIARAIKEARRMFRLGGLDPSPLRTLRGRGFLLAGPVIAREGGAEPLLPARSRVEVGSRLALLERLESAVRGLDGDRGELVLLLGEPGIGKSWLATQLLRRLRSGPSVGVLGRVPELGPRRSLAPWSQVLRALLERGQVDPGSLSARGAASLRACMPELSDWIGAQADPPGEARWREDATQVAFRLAGQLRILLGPVAGRAGLVVVLEDMHRADPSSLRLLASLADELHDLPLLLLATARDTEWKTRVEQHAHLLELARHPHARVLEVRGLQLEEIRNLIRSETGEPASDAEARSLRDRTAGNPFLALQLLRMPREDEEAGHSARPAASIASLSRELLARHFAPVSRAARDLLTLAAASGLEFDPALLRDAGDGASERVDELLDEAWRARLVTTSGTGGGRLRFVHALVAECLVAEAAPGAVADAHERLARALLARGERADVIAIAHHLLRASPSRRSAELLDPLLQAAERLRERRAFAEEAAVLRAALESVDASGATLLDAEREIALRIGLGEALLHSGQVEAGRRVLRIAGERAGIAGRPLLLARAALSFAGAEESATTDPERVRLLQEAADALREGPNASLVRVEARLAMSLRDDAYAGRRERLATRALARARELGDAGLVCDALRGAHLALWTPDNLGDREEWAREQLRLARELDDPHRVHDALMDLIADRLEDGDREDVDRLLCEHAGLLGTGPELVHAWHHAHYRVMRALAAGELELAERELARASALGRRSGYELAAQWSGVQTFTLRREQGRLAELATPLASVARATPIAAWRLAAALAAAEAGDASPAREVLSGCTAGGSLRLPRDFTWLVGAVLCLELAECVSDEPARRVAHEGLAPYASRHATLYGMLDWGRVQRWLGPRETPPLG